MYFCYNYKLLHTYLCFISHGELFILYLGNSSFSEIQFLDKQKITMLITYKKFSDHLTQMRIQDKMIYHFKNYKINLIKCLILS